MIVVFPVARAHAAERIPKTYGAFLVVLDLLVRGQQWCIFANVE